MKNLVRLFLILATVSQLSAQDLTFTCRFENCSSADSLILWQPMGLYNLPIQTVKPDKNGDFVFKIKKTSTPQYFNLGVGTEAKIFRMVMLGTEDNVLLTGPCFNLAETQTQNSKLNDALATAKKEMNALKMEMNPIMQRYNRDYYTDAVRIECEKQMADIDKKKLALLEKWRKDNPVVARSLALDTYTTFQNSSKKMLYKTELDYFASEYFQHVNWSDAGYNETPSVFNALRDYTLVLMMPELKLSRNQIRDFLNAAMQKIPAKSGAYRWALGGVMSVMLERQNPLAGDFGARYVTDFPNEDPNLLAQINQYITYFKASQVDIPAQEIAQKDTTGTVRKLSALKGKVVLIDFWASWCGPCRKENPMVVALYKKYKDKGFEIYSVSLDQDGSRWKAAIQQDNLIWENHVSDLGGWSNEAAQRYAVSSIPKTVLVDKNGIITDHNLRGEALERRLKEIFGE
jgi:thiol-disulfide isomerase/thioredoxin